MKYKIMRTDTADAGIRKIILYVAQNFGNEVALKKLVNCNPNFHPQNSLMEVNPSKIESGN